MAGLLLIAWFTPSPVTAHAMLVSSDPADGAILETAPAQVHLVFSESVSVVEGGTRLYARGSDPRSLEATVRDGTVIVSLPTDLADGTYALQWRVISADSHPVAGTLTFTIGQPSVVADVPVVPTNAAMEWGMNVSVWAKYLGLLTTFGLVIGGWSYARADWRTLTRVARWTAVLAIVGSLLELPFAAGLQAGNGRWRWTDMRQLDSATAIAAAIAVAGMAVFLLTSVVPRLRWLATFAVAVACLSPLLTGHTRTQLPVSAMMLADVVHLLAAGFWLGGLVILTLGLRRTGYLQTFSSPEGALTAISRFSALAAWSVALLGISGLAMAWLILDSLRDLIDTAYGRDLLLKVGLVLIVMALAATNRLRILPTLARDHDRALPRLRQLVLSELIVLIAVVGVTSVLVQQNPHRVVEAHEPTILFEGSVALDKANSAEITVRETGNGQVMVTVMVTSTDGLMITPESVTAEWTLPDQGLGPITLTLVGDASGMDYVGTTSLPSSGDWTLTIRARIDRFTDSRGSVIVPVP